MDVKIIEKDKTEFPVLMLSSNKEILMAFKETDHHYEGHLVVLSNGETFCPHRRCYEYRYDWKKEDFELFHGKIVFSN